MAAPVSSLHELAGRRVLVLGLARSGVAAARALAGAGAVVTAYDRRPREELEPAIALLGDLPVALRLGVAPDEARGLLAGADIVVTSPSISARYPTTDPWLREALAATERRGTEVVSEVELFLRLTRARVVAVTGTKGKTTTTALIGAILDAADVPHAVGGNIGRPLIDEVDRLDPESWAVLELSELQLPTISRGADIAVYTNIGADHLDRHASVEAYRAVKGRLAELSAASGRVVLNAEDPGCLELAERLPPGAIAWYGLGPGERGQLGTLDGDWLRLNGRRLMPVDDVPLPGRHLLADALAAASTGHLAGIAQRAIADGIRGFGGVPHRLERLGGLGGVAFVNDSQATIPVAVMAALEAFPAGRSVLIAGGQDKGLDYDALGDAIAARCRAAVLIGETAEDLERAVAERVPIVRAGSMDEAVAAAAALARPGDTVLLSPAAASFDMFADYAARGDAFRQAVDALGASGSGL